MDPQLQMRAVKDANRKFFALAAGHYNTQDPRRQNPHPWLRERLKNLATDLTQNFPGEALSVLDAGCGTGLVLDLAKPFFARRIGVDLSPEMLALLPDPTVEKLVTELEHLPLPDNSVHAVVAFATLHHLFAPEVFFAEALRVLKSGGVLYTDHDIEAAFVARFAWPLRLYRSLFDHWQGFVKRESSLSAKDYELSEFHGGRGLSAAALAASLENLGFCTIKSDIHWQGMGPWQACGLLANGPGRAPLLRLTAWKAK